MSRLVRCVLIAAALPIVLSACATASNPWHTDDEVGRITVHDPRSSVTVYIMPYSGVRRHLGKVSLGGSQEFKIQPSEVEYRLVADYGGREVVSRLFSLTPGNVWTWDLSQNRLSFQGQTRR